LDYSAINWADHFREGGINDDSDNIALSICNTSSRSFARWYPIFRNENPVLPPPDEENLIDLMFTSYAGLTALVNVLLTTAKGVDINTAADGETPLLLAARNGRSATEDTSRSWRQHRGKG
jgi:hypothetical protein